MGFRYHTSTVFFYTFETINKPSSSDAASHLQIESNIIMQRSFEDSTKIHENFEKHMAQTHGKN